MGLLLVGVFTLALQDATVKLIAPETSFWQFQTIRAVGNAFFIVMLAMISGGYGLLLPQNWRPVYFRAVMLSICMFCFFSGAPYLTVAQMAAGLYTYPLFVSLLAGPILGEKVGPWRIAALMIGAAGALFSLDPFAAAGARSVDGMAVGSLSVRFTSLRFTESGKSVWSGCARFCAARWRSRRRNNRWAQRGASLLCRRRA